MAPIAEPCPTFNWGRVEGARSYELVVYQVAEAGEETVPVLRKSLPGSVFGWTPSLDSCLERGGRYAWSVRAVGPEETSDWSAPSLFQVAAGPSQTDFENAMAVVRQYLDARGRGEARATAEAVGEVEPDPVREMTKTSPPPAAVGATQMTVDGGVVATSFTGDGSTLTSLDPANLTSGLAGVSITGSSGDVSCIGCVNSLEIGTGQVASVDIQDGGVTVADIQTSTVQARVSGCVFPNSAIRSIGSDGTATCEVDARTIGAGSFYAEAFNGQVRYAFTERQGRLCFLTFVQLRDVDGGGEDAWCQIFATDGPTGQPLWALEAFTENDADAKCRMHCIDLIDD